MIKRKNNFFLSLLNVLFLILISGMIIFAVSSCRDKESKKPQAEVPSSYRGAEGIESAELTVDGEDTSLGDLYWEDIIIDEVLENLIKTAIKNNHDIRIAAEKILQARAQLTITGSAQYPEIGGGGSFNKMYPSQVAPTPAAPGIIRSFQANLQAFFELDFWGRVRRSTDAARAEMLATNEARNVVLMTLISEVASSYFTLRELDLELEISIKTLATREESYRLVKAREQCGIATMLDRDQAYGLVLSARTTITQLTQQIEQQENYINFLLGGNPGNVPRGLTLAEQLNKVMLPAGIPSTLLVRRPDIRKAEQNLAAADAKVDVARAGHFPMVTLTGENGVLSKALDNLFTGPANTWSFIPQFTVPVFNAGKVTAQVRQAESVQRETLLEYDRTVKNAFMEVSDTLTGYNKQRKLRAEQAELTLTLADQARLSNLRYIGGVSSYLEVLDSERQYFASELELAQAQLNELLYYVKLYKALGGGWQQE
ncbi:MAG: efflux transporter outer membrane subunit [Armatimonadota bacterium]